MTSSTARLAAVQAMVEQMAKVASAHPMHMVEVTRELFMDTVVLPLHDPTIARDIEAGAALNSDKAERVLIDILMPSREHHENCKTRSGGNCDCWFKREKPFVTQRARAILAALREGLAEPDDDPDSEEGPA